MIYSYPLKKLAEEFNLELVYRSSDYDKIQITVDDVTRPGIQLSGYFEHFEAIRLCVMGTTEISYMKALSHEQCYAIFERLLSYRIPAMIYARNLDVPEECLECARLYDITILRSADSTSRLASSLITKLKGELAPRITRHGVLVEIYGEGVLLCGDSGIGKSEAAVELLKRGHRLIADDAVEIRRISPTMLNGTAPNMIRHFIELRGIGVVNVARLFGMGAIKNDSNIDLIVNIVHWEDGYEYDRLGLEEQFTDVLGVQIPTLTIPVTPGRNLAVILEVAAMNNRQKRLGYNPAEELTAQLNQSFNSNAF